MKLNSTEESSGIVGDVLGIDASIDHRNIHKLYSMFETPYKYPIAAVIREYCSNAWDAHIDANKKDTAITAKIEYSSINGHSFIVEDFGFGMDKEFMTTKFMSYLHSEKENTNTAIGAYGIGSKSGLGYGKHIVNIESTVNYITYSYLLSKDKGQPSLIVLSETSSTKKSGVKIIIPILLGDVLSFQRGMVEMLMFFENIIITSTADIQISKAFNDAKIIKTKSFMLNSIIFNKDIFPKVLIPSGNVGLVAGPVLYKVDWDKVHTVLELPNSTNQKATLARLHNISAKVAIRAEIGEIDIPFQREEPIYTYDNCIILWKKAEIFLKDFKSWMNKYCFQEITDSPEFWKGIFESKTAFISENINHSILGIIPKEDLYVNADLEHVKTLGKYSWLNADIKVKRMVDHVKLFNSPLGKINRHVPPAKLTGGYSYLYCTMLINSTTVPRHRVSASKLIEIAAVQVPNEVGINVTRYSMYGKSISTGKTNISDAFKHPNKLSNVLKQNIYNLFVAKYIAYKKIHVISDVSAVTGSDLLPKGTDAQVLAFYSHTGIKIYSTHALFLDNVLIDSYYLLNKTEEEIEKILSSNDCLIQPNKEINNYISMNFILFHGLYNRFFADDQPIMLTVLSNGAEAHSFQNKLTDDNMPVIGLPSPVLNYLISQDELDNSLFKFLHKLPSNKDNIMMDILKRVLKDKRYTLYHLNTPNIREFLDISMTSVEFNDLLSPDMNKYLWVIATFNKDSVNISADSVKLLVNTLTQEEIRLLRKWYYWIVRTIEFSKNSKSKSSYLYLWQFSKSVFELSPEILDKVEKKFKYNAVKNITPFIEQMHNTFNPNNS